MTVVDAPEHGDFTFCRVCFPMIYPESTVPFHNGHHSRGFEQTGMDADVWEGDTKLLWTEEAVTLPNRAGMLVLEFVYDGGAAQMCPICRSSILRRLRYLPNGRITGTRGAQMRAI
jgi:hypothetical protein